MVQTSEDFITPKDFEIVIRKWFDNSEVTILEHNLTPLSDKVEGFLGEHRILKITASKDGSVTRHRFFVKLFPNGSDAQKEMATKFHGFERELGFFNYFAEELRKVVPGYQATFAPRYVFGKKNEFLLCEDLSLKGYTMYKQVILEMNMEHVKVVIKAVAELHAGSLAYEEIKSKQSGSTFRWFSEDRGIYGVRLFCSKPGSIGNHWTIAGLNALKSLADLVPEVGITKNDIQNFFDLISDRMTARSKFRNVVSHHDMWVKNMMFKYQDDVPVSAKLVDYQMLSYLPPAQDVLDFLFLNTTKEFKVEHLSDMFHLYYNILKKELQVYGIDVEQILPFEEIKESVDYLIPETTLKAAIYKTIINIDDEYLTKLLADEERLKSVFLEDRSPVCINQFHTFSGYSDQVRSMLEDLREVALEKNPWHVV